MKKKKTFLVLLVSALLILVLDRAGGLKWLKAGPIRLTGRLRESGYRKVVNPSDSGADFERQLFSCQNEILSLREENLRLRKLLGAGIKPETQFLLGRVIGANQSQLMVALTSPEEVKNGASVVSDRVLLGRVERVEANLVRVQLLTDSKLKIPVKIWLRKQLAQIGEVNLAEGILTSEGGRLIVREILAQEKIAPDYWVGAVVETGDIFLIGPITKVFPSKDKVFQEAEVKWLINPRELLTVAIIKNNSSQ